MGIFEKSITKEELAKESENFIEENAIKVTGRFVWFVGGIT